MAQNKYHHILARILAEGKRQSNRKGEILYLLNQSLSLSPADLLDIFEGHGIARKKLRTELSLFLGNVHIYANNIDNTWHLLDGDDAVKFELNV